MLSIQPQIEIRPANKPDQIRLVDQIKDQDLMASLVSDNQTKDHSEKFKERRYKQDIMSGSEVEAPEPNTQEMKRQEK